MRFGDPETQVVLPLITEDLTGLLAEAAAGRLRTDAPLRPRRGGVRGARRRALSRAPPRTGDPIEGLDGAAERPGVTVFHAGTARAD